MSSTVRISENGRRVLAELARDADTNMTAILDEALAEDSSADSGYRAELTELEGTTSSDGLDPYAP